MVWECTRCGRVLLWQPSEGAKEPEDAPVCMWCRDATDKPDPRGPSFAETAKATTSAKTVVETETETETEAETNGRTDTDTDTDTDSDSA